MTKCMVCGEPASEHYSCNFCGKTFCPKCGGKYLAIVSSQGMYSEKACSNCIANRNLRVIDPNHTDYMN